MWNGKKVETCQVTLDRLTAVIVTATQRYIAAQCTMYHLDGRIAVKAARMIPF